MLNHFLCFLIQLFLVFLLIFMNILYILGNSFCWLYNEDFFIYRCSSGYCLFPFLKLYVFTICVFAGMGKEICMHQTIWVEIGGQLSRVSSLLSSFGSKELNSVTRLGAKKLYLPSLLISPDVGFSIVKDVKIFSRAFWPSCLEECFLHPKAIFS